MELSLAQVTKQKGVASSTPSVLKRWVLSKLMTYVISEGNQTRRRKKAEAKRLRDGRAHVVEYFHQVDDGYSHLAVQTLGQLRAQYDIELIIHLVPASNDDNSPEPDLLQEMSRTDAAAVAPYYGLQFPETIKSPTPESKALATAILCALGADQFIQHAPTISSKLWQGDDESLMALAKTLGKAPQEDVKTRLDAGADRRRVLKHYSGAMFYYEDEWYWGVDRLYHLEERLKSLGALKDPSLPSIAPRPEIPTTYTASAARLTLEYFPSLRSPYTAVSWDPTMQLVRHSGVQLSVRPVLPMVMRGVPATFEKAFYVFKDAAREARASKQDYGRFFDPIGEPVKRGYSLYNWALGQEKGQEVLGAFLKAAFVKGINTNSLAGMRKVAAMAGLDWQEAKNHLDDTSWQETLENNRQAMYSFGSWGVPSYRLLDENGKTILGVWGQDRLWLIAKKIEEIA